MHRKSCRNIRVCSISNKQSRNEDGLILIELMLAVALTIVLSALLTRIYFMIHKSVSMQQDLIQHQYMAARTRMILDNAIRSSGYAGCSSLRRFNQIKNFSLRDSGSVLEIEYQQFPGVTLIKNISKSSRIATDDFVQYHQGQLLIISDCRNIELFRVADVAIIGGVQYITPARTLRHHFERYAEIGAYTSDRYYVAKSHHQHSVGISLYRKEIDGATTELVAGIDRLQLKYDRAGVFYTFTTITSRAQYIWHGYSSYEAVNIP